MVRRACLRSAGVLLAMMTAIGAVSADDGYRKADGLVIYLGVVPAPVVRGHPTSHAESTMHGGARTSRHQQHVVVAVFDSQTGARVENARVAVTIDGLGHVGRQSIQLDPMRLANTITYGGFVTLPGNDSYDITVEITVPERSRPISVTFSSDHIQ